MHTHCVWRACHSSTVPANISICSTCDPTLSCSFVGARDLGPNFYPFTAARPGNKLVTKGFFRECSGSYASALTTIYRLDQASLGHSTIVNPCRALWLCQIQHSVCCTVRPCLPALCVPNSLHVGLKALALDMAATQCPVHASALCVTGLSTVCRVCATPHVLRPHCVDLWPVRHHWEPSAPGLISSLLAPAQS